jgi:hypothetical protein
MAMTFGTPDPNWRDWDAISMTELKFVAELGKQTYWLHGEEDDLDWALEEEVQKWCEENLTGRWQFEHSSGCAGAIFCEKEEDARLVENKVGVNISPYGPRFDREVICLHCLDIYNENELVFEQRFGNPIAIWWCRNESCDGAGIGHDIFGTDWETAQPALWRKAFREEHGFCPGELGRAIESFAQRFAPRKTLTTKHPLKQKRLMRLRASAAGRSTYKDTGR